MKHKTKTMKHNHLITKMLDWVASVLIAVVMAVLVIGLIFAASIQHADRLAEMAVMEVTG